MFDEFSRNIGSPDLPYSHRIVDDTSVLVIGDTPVASELIGQLFVYGFSHVGLWTGSTTRPDGCETLSAKAHLRATARHRKDAAQHIPLINSGYDCLGFRAAKEMRPDIVICTENNDYLQSVIASWCEGNDVGCITAQTVMDHATRHYGLRVSNGLTDVRNNAFDHVEHDPFMAKICAAYAGTRVAQYALQRQDPMHVAPVPANDFMLFPFGDTLHSPSAARTEVTYDGFFKDLNLYVAGLGGGILIVDTLLKIFNARHLRGVDHDRLERTNFNRLIPLAHERLIGKKKTEAASIIYAKECYSRDVQFIDDVIASSLCVEETWPDIMFGVLSGWDNKHALVALSQKLSLQKHHTLIDVGVEPFRTDVTNYIRGHTPCDHCRTLHDLAVTELLSQIAPNCDRRRQGSTIFANMLGHLGIIEAMKYTDPSLGRPTTGVTTTIPIVTPAGVSYFAVDSSRSAKCDNHMSVSPVNIDLSSYHLQDISRNGEPMTLITDSSGRRIGAYARSLP